MRIPQKERIARIMAGLKRQRSGLYTFGQFWIERCNYNPRWWGWTSWGASSATFGTRRAAINDLAKFVRFK